MNCDMCGKNEELKITIVEGAKMQLCRSCSSYGKVLGNVKTKEQKIEEEQRIKDLLEKGTKKRYKDFETHESIASNFGQIIRKKREMLGINQEDFAKMLNIRQSEIHHMEHGDFRPPIELAKKIEKALKIRLIVEESSNEKTESTSSGPLTIGDILKSRK